MIPTGLKLGIDIIKNEQSGYEEKLFAISIGFEVLFFLDMASKFFLTYIDDHSKRVEEHLPKIRRHYLHSDFIWDLIALIPFQMIKLKNNRNCLFYLIKILRLYKGFNLLHVPTIMRKIKAVYKARADIN